MPSVAIGKYNLTPLRTFANMVSRRPALFIGLLALGLYLSTLTADYYWDGLAFAVRIERVARRGQGFDLLFHQNHLIYNAIGYVFYIIPNSLGLAVRALTMLQIMSALSCALGVAMFFRMTLRISGNLYIAGVGSALLAVSTGWWKSATDADAYSLSIALVLVCINAVLSEKPRWHVAGLALAGAMLVHELACLCYFAAIAAVFLNEKIDKRVMFALKFSLLAGGVTVVAYYVCAAMIFDIASPLEIIRWAASNPYGVPFSNPIKELPVFPKRQLDLVFGHSLRTFRRLGGIPEWSFAIIGVAAAFASLAILKRRSNIGEVARSFWRSNRDRNGAWRRMIILIFVWMFPYVLFLLTWEPYLLYYRLYYLPSLVLVFVLALTNYHRKTKRPASGAGALLVLALGFCNLAFFIGPHMRSSSNPLIDAARKANEKWNDRTVIYSIDDGVADGSFRYFNPKTEWRAGTPKAIKRLDEEIERIYAEGGSVWVSTAVNSVKPEWLADHAYGDLINVELGDTVYQYVQLLPARSYSDKSSSSAPR